MVSTGGLNHPGSRCWPRTLHNNTRHAVQPYSRLHTWSLCMCYSQQFTQRHVPKGSLTWSPDQRSLPNVRNRICGLTRSVRTGGLNSAELLNTVPSTWPPRAGYGADMPIASEAYRCTCAITATRMTQHHHTLHACRRAVCIVLLACRCYKKDAPQANYRRAPSHSPAYLMPQTATCVRACVCRDHPLACAACSAYKFNISVSFPVAQIDSTRSQNTAGA